MNVDQMLELVKAQASELQIVLEDLSDEGKAFVQEQATELAALSGTIPMDRFVRVSSVAAHGILQHWLGRTVTGFDATDAALWGFFSALLVALAGVL